MKLISSDYLEKHLPPNIDVEQSRIFVLSVPGISAFIELFFFILRYFFFYNRLFAFVNGKKIIIEGMMMCAFKQFVIGICFVCLCSIVCFLGYSLSLYYSFFDKSQSIYLMRRLPDNKKTLWHMVLDVPVRGILLTAIVALVILIVAFLVWRFYTPAVCLPL